MAIIISLVLNSSAHASEVVNGTATVVDEETDGRPGGVPDEIPTYKLIITIRDQYLYPVESAIVTILKNDVAILLGDSDEFGVFQASHLVIGEYLVSVDFMGDTKSQTVLLDNNKTLVFEFRIYTGFFLVNFLYQSKWAIAIIISIVLIIAVLYAISKWVLKPLYSKVHEKTSSKKQKKKHTSW